MRGVKYWSKVLQTAIVTGHALRCPPNHTATIPAAAIRNILAKLPTDRDPAALRVYGFSICGHLVLDEMSVPLALDFVDCLFDSPISLYATRLATLHLGSCQIPGLMLNAARASGNVNVEGSTFYAPVTAMGMRIDGQLAFSNASFPIFESATREGLGDYSQPHSGAYSVLALDRSAVDSIVALDGISAAGHVSAAGLSAQSLTLQNSHVSLPGYAAVDLSGITCSGGICLDGVQVEGGVRLNSSQLSTIQMCGAEVVNPGWPAIDMERCRVRENILLTETSCQGEMLLNGATAAQVNLEGARLINPDAPWALTAEHLAATTMLLRGTYVEGFCDLMSSNIEHFILDPVPPPPEACAPVLDLTGANFAQVSGYPAMSRQNAVAWLERRPDNTDRRVFVAQPWHQLALASEQNGRPEDARWLRYQAARRSARTASGLNRVSSWLYGVFAGHGYYAGRRALVWLAILFTVVWVLGWAAAPLFRPLEPSILPDGQQVTGATPCQELDSSVTCFSPPLFALETMVPAAGNAQVNAWVPDDYFLLASLSALHLAGWILTALLLASATGLLRKG